MNAHSKLAIIPLLALAPVLAFGTSGQPSGLFPSGIASVQHSRDERVPGPSAAAISVAAHPRALVLDERASVSTRHHMRFEWHFASALLAGLYLLFFALLKALFVRRRAPRSPLAL
jgi:hypothetical protein